MNKQDKFFIVSAVMVVFLLIGVGVVGAAYDANGSIAVNENWLAGLGMPLAVVLLFLLGLSLNLTPCVYPLIPVTVSYFGAGTEKSVRDRLQSALLFFAGLTLFYTLLGVLAGHAGIMFGELFQNSYVLVALALLMLVLAGGMFDFYQFELPYFLQGSMDTVSDKLGSFGLGLTMGLVASPCVGPPVVALLAFVSEQGSVLLGGTYFFFLSAGLAAPYLFLAFYAPALNSLPGAGRWMLWIERLFGFVLCGLALYFLTPLLGVLTYNILLGLIILLAVINLNLTAIPRNKIYLILKLLALIVVGLGLFLFFRVDPASSDAINWLDGEDYVAGDFAAGPRVIYVRADWCFPCRLMERNVFAREDVQEQLDRLLTVKIDITHSPASKLENWLIENQVRGVPTLIFKDCDGQEISHLRKSGYEAARGLIEKTEFALESCGE